MDKSNSLSQYIDFYREHGDSINRSSLFPGKDMRDCAFDKLIVSHLAEKGDEGYETISMNDIFKPDLGINIFDVDVIGKKTVVKCGAEAFNCIRIILHNEKLFSVELPKGCDNMPDGLTIEPLDNKNCDTIPEIIREIHASEDPAINLNIMLGMEGLLIKVSPDVAVELPVQIINYSGSGSPLLNNRKLFVKLGHHSRLTLMNCDHSVDFSNNAEIVNNVLTAICLDEGASLKYVEMEETCPANSRVSNMLIHQRKDSRLSIGTLTLINGVTRNNIFVSTQGDNTESFINGLSIGKGKSSISNFTKIDHNNNHGRSDQLFKYALFDESVGSFEGKIDVMQSSRFNEAYQNNRNILAGEKAKMFSKPQLLIYNDDVKCSHGATTGQLDQQAIFYMQTRGIALEEAKSMLMQAFMNDVVDRIDLSHMSDRMYHLVERRLKGDDVFCANCKITKSDD